MLRDLEYIQSRAQQERAAAEAAATDQARRIHLELASRYEDILRAYGVETTRAA